jgi:hypothetical protein
MADASDAVSADAVDARPPNRIAAAMAWVMMRVFMVV